jgi:hypothetical protein
VAIKLAIPAGTGRLLLAVSSCAHAASSPPGDAVGQTNRNEQCPGNRG